MAGVGRLNIETGAARPANAGTVVLGDLQIFVHGVSDDAAERARMSKERGDVERQIATKESKLANDGFVRNAKPEVVEAERDRLESLRQQRAALDQNLALLG
ncbi:MAG: hypothetical protein HOP29_14595 [Phycisphaerales bacterium]|nr:hypothetical protein [Phycisphaerales bacterium]